MAKLACPYCGRETDDGCEHLVVMGDEIRSGLTGMHPELQSYLWGLSLQPDAEIKQGSAEAVLTALLSYMRRGSARYEGQFVGDADAGLGAFFSPNAAGCVRIKLNSPADCESTGRRPLTGGAGQRLSAKGKRRENARQSL